MDRYTLNDAAKKLGLSKNAVKYRMKKINQEYVVNDNGMWFVTEDGLTEIASMYGSDAKSTEPAEDSTKGDTGSMAVYEEYIATLKDEIAQKNKQLEDLQRLFDQAQKLHAQEMLLLQKPQEESAKDEKKSFWDIFKKK